MTTTREKRPTRRELVLQTLQRAAGRPNELMAFGEGEIHFQLVDGWVDAWILHHPAIGGSEGLRRVRELRAEGHEIEMRKHPLKSRETRQYRLVATAPKALRDAVAVPLFE